jgi:serine/threonine protein kinase
MAAISSKVKEEILSQSKSGRSGQISTSEIMFDDKTLIISDTILGKGAYGSVYLGQILSTDGGSLPVAVKRYNIQKLPKDYRESIISESRALLRLSRYPECYETIMCYYVLLTGEEYYDLVVEYIKGYSLEFLLKNNIKGKFPLSYVISVMSELLRTFIFIHSKNIIHGDIKPDNILRDSKTKKFKIVDFGFSCEIGINCDPDHVRGTPRYLAPELLKRTVKKGELYKTDNYSLGGVFFYLANLRPPMSNIKGRKKALESVMSDAPNERSEYGNIVVDQVIDGLREKNPQNRLELQEALLSLSNI